MDNLQKISIILSNLKNPIKLHIIDYLSDKDASNQEVFEFLSKAQNVKYRSGVYNSLKDLQNAGIIEKYYDTNKNKIMYKLIIRTIILDLEKMNISLLKKTNEIK